MKIRYLTIVKVLLLTISIVLAGCGSSDSGDPKRKEDSNEASAPQELNETESPSSIPDTSTSESLIGSHLELSFTTSSSTLEADEEVIVREVSCIRCGAAIIARVDLYKSKVKSYIELNEDFIKQTAGIHATNSASILTQLNDAEKAWTELFLSRVDSFSIHASRDSNYPAQLIGELNEEVSDLFKALKLRLGSLAIVEIT